MASTYINSEQITAIASNLREKGNNILNQYKTDCTSALNMSTECLQLSGLDTTEFFKALESIYGKLNDQITGFADFLSNTVASEYDFTSQAITASFNNDFANSISSLLGVSVRGSATVVNQGISGTTGPNENRLVSAPIGNKVVTKPSLPPIDKGVVTTPGEKVIFGPDNSSVATSSEKSVVTAPVGGTTAGGTTTEASQKPSKPGGSAGGISKPVERVSFYN